MQITAVKVSLFISELPLLMNTLVWSCQGLFVELIFLLQIQHQDGF